ncbi:MAG: pyridoxal-phosphate dependent enzyme [Saprospiraceae bacterium]
MDIESPLQEIPAPEGYRLFLKRDDLLHAEIQGNKWRKMRPVLDRVSKTNTTIISFGGAFSNHIHALASAGKTFQFPTIGIIRGMGTDLSNPTLSHATGCGMRLLRVSKSDYTQLKKASLQDVISNFGFSEKGTYELLPEGGDTSEAVESCSKITEEILQQLPADYGNKLFICVPAGTGCTAAGIISGLRMNGKTLIFPAAPYGIDEQVISEKLERAGYTQEFDFQIITSDLRLKFAEMTPELFSFCESFRQRTQIQLDPIYTSKMMHQLYLLISQQFFPPDSCIVALHTGGIQGWNGMNTKIERQNIKATHEKTNTN